MYKLLVACIISICTLVPAYYGYKTSKDFFSPIPFYNLFSYITIVPRLLSMDANLYTNTLDKSTLTRYMIITCLGILTVNFGFFVCDRRLKRTYSLDLLESQSSSYSDSTSTKEYKSDAFIFLLFIIGAASKVYLLLKSGGLSYIWANINKRTTMLAGNNYLNSLEILMIVATALMLEKALITRSRSYGVRTFVLAAITSLLLLSFGGRSSFVKLIVLLLFVVNFRYKRFVLSMMLRLRYILVFLAVALIIVMIPMVRSSDFADIYLNPSLWFKYAFLNISKVFDSISAVDRDMMTYDLFANLSFWKGKSYLGLLYAWIPRSIFPDKPPVDDGVYLANLIWGFKVEPILPYNEIPLHSSSPFSSFGIMYANFGAFGVVIGALVLAWVYVYVYNRMAKNGYRISSVLIYGYLMFAFGLSIHAMLSLIVPAAVIWLSVGEKPIKIKFTLKGKKR